MRLRPVDGLRNLRAMDPGFRRTFLMSSPDETGQFARGLAPKMKQGDTLLLSGDLGAGKTHLARALIKERLARAGRDEDVPSPTYTLVQTYDDGITEIWHCDLYRLSDPGEIDELGLEEAFDQAICLVEWPDRLQDRAPSGALRLHFTMQDRQGERLLTVSSQDKRWEAQLCSDAERLTRG